MKNRLIAILFFSALCLGCGSKKSQLAGALEDVLMVERGLLYFYEQGGVGTLSMFLTEGKAKQIALIEGLAKSKGIELEVKVDTIRIHNSMEDAILENLYRAKAAEEYLLGVSYVELEMALERYRMEGESYSDRGMESAQANIDLLVKLLQYRESQ
ncbi:MAG: hypothetical protein R3Y49_02610 [Rikenellaceae bacterium]